MQSHDDMRLKHMLDSALNFHLTTPQVSFLVPCAFHLLPLTFHLSPFTLRLLPLFYPFRRL
jgi:hypothetical protein